MRRAPVAALVTVAALAAGGCGTSSSPTADLFSIPGMTSQKLLGELEHPTTRGPGGYPMVAGPDRLSLRGIRYTTQGRGALAQWLNTASSTHAAYQQAGRNLAIAFPGEKAQINGKLK